MTAQAPDLLLFNGELLPLFTNPLASYLESLGTTVSFEVTSTANWRGYVATWEIRDRALWLVGINGWMVGQPPAAEKGDSPETQFYSGAPEVPLAYLFPEHDGPIKAQWFSGTLRIPRGNPVRYVHMGYQSVYEREMRMTIEQGVVTDIEDVDTAEQGRQQERAHKARLDEMRPLLEHAVERARVVSEHLDEERPTTVDDWGWAPCPHCGQAFCVRDKKHWDGQRHWCGGRIVLTSVQD